jgi:long-chain acyl-CoA synthetase
MNMALWLERVGRADPARIALAQGSYRASYGELAALTARRAGTLQTRYGIKPGDRIAIVAENDVRYFKAFYAIWHAGACAVPVNAKLHGREIAYILEHSGARLAIVSQAMEGIIAEFAPATLERMIVMRTKEWGELTNSDPVPVAQVSHDELAWLFYTSGTTGRPKGAMLSHGNLAACSFAYAMEQNPTGYAGAILHAAPMSHGSGLYMMAHVMGGGVNVIPESGHFDADEILSLLPQWQGLSMFAAPTMIKRLTQSGVDAGGQFGTIVWGGAPMYVADSLNAISRFGPVFGQLYGQGESPMTITRLTRDEIAASQGDERLFLLGTAGRAFASMECAILDQDDRPVAPGEMGEICARGPAVMRGYWNNETASVDTLRNGWLHTGDVGTIDARGFLTLKDRSKDLVISGGSNIYPREIEEVLLRHPDVREVSIIGRPDPEWGEIIVAYVVGGATPSELDALCLSELARFKRPKHYIAIDALPKNNYGKVLKTELRIIDAKAHS